MTPVPDDPSTVYVHVRYSNGGEETFGKEVDLLELLLEPSGKLYAFHLILNGSRERDTQRWLMTQNLASFQWRYGSTTAKSKVRVRLLSDVEPDLTVSRFETKDYK